MQVKDFNFTLPKELIAQEPIKPRNAAKLLVVKKNNDFIDKHIYDLPDMFKENDLFVVNDTEVLPVKLRCRNKNLTITLFSKLSITKWLAYANPLKKCNLKDILNFSDDFQGEIIDLKEGHITIKLLFNNKDLNYYLNKYGEMPLPPYIKRKYGAKLSDHKDYNTIFAHSPGSVAAPTAGLHFDNYILNKFKLKNINFVKVTLHVGRGTFLPVRSKDTKQHVIHTEQGYISSFSAKKINETKIKGGRIIAVGTTVLRILESALDEKGFIKKFNGETNIFILPGYKIKSIDYLLTNFHLPKSTLFMLVCAFTGVHQMKRAYEYAICNKYRFYSYGDAMLLSKP